MMSAESERLFTSGYALAVHSETLTLDVNSGESAEKVELGYVMFKVKLWSLLTQCITIRSPLSHLSCS